MQQDELAETIAEIRYFHRNRCYAMETRKALDLRLGWFLKTQLGWSKSAPKPERDAIAMLATDFVKTGEKIAKGVDVERPKGFDELEGIILAAIMARAPFDSVEKDAKKAMEKLALSLPVWEWADGIRGFGPVSLAIIIAETGDLFHYSNPAKVWKRMGVGIVGDVRQGGLPKTAKKEDWVAHGYSRTRRSRMWNIGDALVKGNRDGRYRTLYLDRKEYEAAKAVAEGLIVAPSASIPKGKAVEYRSQGHIHRRAQRYMEKRLLRDLWNTWKGQPIEYAWAAE